MKIALPIIALAALMAITSNVRSEPPQNVNSDEQGGRYRLVMALTSGGYSQPYVIDTQTGRVWRQVFASDKNMVVFEPCIYKSIDNQLSSIPNETTTGLVQIPTVSQTPTIQQSANQTAQPTRQLDDYLLWKQQQGH
jgi:hypothetical protein